MKLYSAYPYFKLNNGLLSDAHSETCSDMQTAEHITDLWAMNEAVSDSNLPNNSQPDLLYLSGWGL